MKHFVHRRIGSLLLAATVFAGVLSAFSAAGAENRAEWRTVFSYTSKMNNSVVSDSFLFSDEWFQGDPGERNDRLGLASACMTAVSGDGDQMVELLGKLGFSDMRELGFDSADETVCACAIGEKPIFRNGKTATLVAVVFQGRDYGARGWMQNVTINAGTESTEQASYAAAARAFLADLDSMAFDGDPIFWICGLSRAGGIANLVSARLLERENPPAVFCYTFESPAVTANKTSHDARYGSIHNYVSADDPVPRIPLWGMTRYGQDYFYDSVSPEDVSDLILQHNPGLEDYLDRILTGTFREDAVDMLQTLTGNLERLIPTRNDYSAVNTVDLPSGRRLEYTWQDGLQTLCRLVFSGRLDFLMGTGMIKTASQWDLIPGILEMRRKQLQADSGFPPAVRIQDRLEKASLIAPVISVATGTKTRKESVYAMIEIFDAVLYPDVVLEEHNRLQAGLTSGPEAGKPDSERLFDVIVSLRSALLFSHHPDVIIARMKILAASSSGE